MKKRWYLTKNAKIDRQTFNNFERFATLSARFENDKTILTKKAHLSIPYGWLRLSIGLAFISPPNICISASSYPHYSVTL